MCSPITSTEKHVRKTEEGIFHYNLQTILLLSPKVSHTRSPLHFHSENIVSHNGTHFICSRTQSSHSIPNTECQCSLSLVLISLSLFCCFLPKLLLFHSIVLQNPLGKSCLHSYPCKHKRFWQLYSN